MALFDLLKMTKVKGIFLLLIMLFLVPSYYHFNCINAPCTLGTNDCVCGFLYLEFFVSFIWSYVIACVLGEAAKFLNKIVNKNKKN